LPRRQQQLQPPCSSSVLLDRQYEAIVNGAAFVNTATFVNMAAVSTTSLTTGGWAGGHSAVAFETVGIIELLEMGGGDARGLLNCSVDDGNDLGRMPFMKVREGVPVKLGWLQVQLGGDGDVTLLSRGHDGYS
jgi:hypothetical protein